MNDKPKILLVDDKIENIIALEKLFSELDADFIRAMSGNEALKKTLENDFALALIDVQMPDMDGYETVELMRQDKKTENLPVIFISAIYSDDIYQIKGIGAGAVDFITKPINPKILNGKIKVHLELYRHKVALQKVNDNLELLVKERTKELMSANEQLIKEVADRQQAEETLIKEKEKLQKYLDIAAIIVVMLDADQRVELINKKGCDILGYAAEEIIGENWFDNFIPEKERDDVKVVFDKMMAGENDSVDYYENEVLTENGEKRLIAWFNTVLRDKNGNIINALGTGADITERKHLEEEKQKLNKLESIGILAGGIAHDFNNVLAGILNNIHISKMHMDRESKEHKNLESAEKGINRAANLTQQLLTFSKGGAPIKSTASIIDIISESAEFALTGSNVKYEYVLMEDLWPVEVDKGQMNQVIHNLTLNADQAMPEGGTIRISVENIELDSDRGLPLREGKYLKIAIQDQGSGITEEHLQKLFDPYFTTKEMGRGLGLSISYSIIRQHDGLLTAESELGVGTTFTIYLPASEKQVQVIEVVSDELVAGEGKILIMDDEEIIRKSFGEFLTMTGYKVEYAKDGEEAIELHGKAIKVSEPFDAVILDLTIRGGMGGKEAVRKLHEVDPDVKTIVSSGYSNDPVMSNHKEHGFNAVFCKASNSPDDLCRILNKVIVKNRP